MVSIIYILFKCLFLDASFLVVDSELGRMYLPADAHARDTDSFTTAARVVSTQIRLLTPLLTVPETWTCKEQPQSASSYVYMYVDSSSIICSITVPSMMALVYGQ